ncbi:hypothetical protein Flexsi_1995 [Flexistipes sinusarabici DSM 4947]|uniref:Uncharacterized protein n=1 Tax=Flexistipes sinusarabici (strain ATCC 49648 / DSM 4947 / MAS 10) TaxID=717231 RepID=F8E4R6_FLESM|nr:hypothetical protein [Flexistipes sinusarabici]AEI15624.1 hypothetical protein Flexsi_1995 [Flexistipes sinusarabici DSM 4947]
MNYNVKIFAVVVLVIFISFPAYAGYLVLDGGYGLTYQKYKKTSDKTSDLDAGSQLDELFARLRYRRELMNERLGYLQLNTKITENNLNYFESQNPEFSVPFTSNDSAKNKDDALFYDVNPRAFIRIPTKKLRFGFDYSLNKSVDTDAGDHFDSLGKISNDIKELGGVTQSLGDYDETERQKYFLYRSGDLNVVAKYFGYNYDYGYDVEEEDENFLKSDVFAQAGTSYKRYAGIYYEKETSTFKDSKTDHDEYTVKAGTISAEGLEDELELGNLRFSAFGQKNVVDKSSLESNDGSEYTNAEVNLGYEKRIYDLNNRVYYDKDEQADTGELDETIGYVFSFDSDALDLSYYLESEIYKERVEEHNLRENNISLSSFNSLIADGLNGTGTITITTDNNQIILDLTNLIVDDELLTNPNLIINPGESYQISFTESVSGSIALTVGDANDVSIDVQRDLQTAYDKIGTKSRAGYNFKELESFKNRFNIEYKTASHNYDPDKKFRVVEDDYTDLKLSQEFDIRPWFLILDKSASYRKYNEESSTDTASDEWREEYLFKSKDGFYTKKNKFYLVSEIGSKYGQGYDTRNTKRFMLYAEKSTENMRLGFFPERKIEKEPDNYKKTTDSYELKFRLYQSNLRAEYEEEIKDYYNTAQKDEERISKNLNYRLDLRNIRFNARYNSTKYVYTTEFYEANLVLVKRRSFPANVPYVKLELGFERDRNNKSGDFEKDDYVTGKITYTPTSRLEAIFSFEKQINAADDEGIDYEFIAKYSTNVFKLSLGYRRNETTENNNRRVEDVIYFEIRKSFGIGYRGRRG